MSTKTKANKVSEQGVVEISNPENWVDEYGDFLFAYSLRYFGNKEVAEDLVQETFLAALSSFENFKGESSFRTWLCSILRHKIFDRLRSSRREIHAEAQSFALNHQTLEELVTESPLSGRLSLGADPEKLLCQSEFLATLEECLMELPERHRQIFLMHEVEGLTKEEITDSLGITTANLRVILHRSRAALRISLGKRWRNEEKQIVG